MITEEEKRRDALYLGSFGLVICHEDCRKIDVRAIRNDSNYQQGGKGTYWTPKVNLKVSLSILCLTLT